MSEHTEQVFIMHWARMLEGQYPELALLAAIPNGAKLPYVRRKGQRYSPEAIHLKAEGLKPGFPDMILPVPRKNYHGLFIELKFGTNKATPEQTAWLAALNAQGYLAVLCRGADQAITVISDYLEIDHEQA